MESITIKEIAGYLPYKLQIKSGNGNVIREMVCDRKFNDEEEFKIKVPIFNVITGIGHKPFLYPLSSLTSEIFHNGNIFCPVDVIGEEITEHCNVNFVDDWSEKGGNFLDYMDEFIKRVHNNHHLDFMPYGFIQKLYEWHFDVHGLIERGLAIDKSKI